MFQFDFSEQKYVSELSDSTFNTNYLSQISTDIQISADFFRYETSQNEFILSGLLNVVPTDAEFAVDHAFVMRSFLRNTVIWQTESPTEHSITSSALTITTSSSADDGTVVYSQILTTEVNNNSYDDKVNFYEIDSYENTISSLDVPADVSIELNKSPQLRDEIFLYAGVGYDLDYTLEGTTFDDLFEDDGDVEKIKFIGFILDDEPEDIPFDIWVQQEDHGVNFHRFDVSDLELGENTVEMHIQDEHGMTSWVDIEIELLNT